MTERPRQLINDPYFRVEIDFDGSSANPAKGIWKGQHVCVAEGFAFDDPIPDNPAEAVIKHQFKPKHWGVLSYGFVVLHFEGFPHDTVMQLVRHQDSKPLVQSMRYTGHRMIEVANDELDVDKAFYYQPAGEYSTRDGKYQITEEDRFSYFVDAYESAKRYSLLIQDGKPEDVARRSLIAGFRQNFSMAGTIQAVFHWLDQRTLADSQIEAQTLAWMALDKLKEWQPEFFEWYEKNRAGKNLLSP